MANLTQTLPVEVILNAPNARDLAQSLSLKVYQNLHDLEELEPLWDNLVADYPLASIFCTWEWLTSWWQSFGNRRNLLVLALFDSASHLLGLAPLSISTEPFLGPFSLRLLRLMGDGSGDSDNLDFPVRPGFEEIFSGRILEYLEDQRHQWDVSQLNTMPSESPVARLLANALEEPRWTSFESFRNCSAVPLPPNWDEYLQHLSSEDQNNLVRYGRRLHKRYSVRIYRCLSEDELPVCLEALFRLHQSRWQRVGEAGTFSSAARRELYTDLSRRLLARNELELWVAELNGGTAAVQFAMRHKDKVYQLQEGYDPEHASDRVGFVLRGAVLKQLISEGIRVYDFLGGEDAFKERWGAQAGCYRDLYFACSFSRGGVLLNCAQGMVKTEQWLRARLPSVWQVLHRIKLAWMQLREFET